MSFCLEAKYKINHPGKREQKEKGEGKKAVHQIPFKYDRLVQKAQKDHGTIEWGVDERCAYCKTAWATNMSTSLR